MNIQKIIIVLFISLPLWGLTQEETDYEAKWNQGYRFTGNDGNFKLKFGGRIMNDWAFFLQEDAIEDSTGQLTNGTEFRKIRLFNSGTIYGNINYKLQFDFAGGQVKAKDIFIELTELPVVGNLKIGHFKEPFSLEKLTSSKYISFLERPSVTAFNPSRNTGVMLHNSIFRSRMSWQIGWFKDANDFGNNEDAGDSYSITARIAGQPFLNEEKNQFLHTGMGYSYRNVMNGMYSVSARPEAHMAQKYVNTGNIGDVEQVNLFNTELAFVSGPLALQGEFFQSSITMETSGFCALNGSYGQISYLLTGENKSYKSPGSGFDRISPKNNFGSDDGGTGAWEVVLRYSMIDLSEQNGGKMKGLTAGLNWYLNPSVRIMVNYGRTNLYEVGITNVMQVRFQLDF